MSETINIARMAEKLSEEIFSAFGWDKVGPMNQNWKCAHSDEHQNKKTHPSDVVFSYEDPYSREKVYFSADLKSYSRKKIIPSELRPDIISLAQAISCANSGGGWTSLYPTEDENWRTDGMLFVFNHDGEYDGDFREDVLRGIEHDDIKLPAPCRLWALGPPDIDYLANIANDIDAMRGRGAIPPKERCMFWYPDLETVRVRQPAKNAATIETLMGPWQIMQCNPSKGESVHWVIWFRGDGTQSDEYMYLFEFLFHYQMLSQARSCTVTIRYFGLDDAASAAFEIAKRRYIERANGVVEERLSFVKFELASTVRRRFSAVDIGRGL